MNVAAPVPAGVTWPLENHSNSEAVQSRILGQTAVSFNLPFVALKAWSTACFFWAYHLFGDFTLGLRAEEVHVQLAASERFSSLPPNAQPPLNAPYAYERA